MNIHESAEDYLERILMLRLKKRHGSFHSHCTRPGLFQTQRQRGHEAAAGKRIY